MNNVYLRNHKGISQSEMYRETLLLSFFSYLHPFPGVNVTFSPTLMKMVPLAQYKANSFWRNDCGLHHSLQVYSQTTEKVFIRNKVAQVVCWVFLLDYPSNWPEFFSDLLNTLSLGGPAIDIYLRILLAINGDIADRDIPHTAKACLSCLFIPSSTLACTFLLGLSSCCMLFLDISRW